MPEEIRDAELRVMEKRALSERERTPRRNAAA
jgi:hypothetical protein